MTTVDTAVNGIQGLVRYDTDQSAAAAAHKTELGQEDFLTLMTKQLQNQDPFSPMESGEFLGQMAQFSTVSGIEQVNSSLQAMMESFAQGRVAAAANLVGKQALVQTDVTRASSGVISGQLDLMTAADQVKLTFSDAKTGKILEQKTYADVAAGAFDFDWTVTPEDMAHNRDLIRVTASVATGDISTTVGTKLYNNITAIDLTGSNTSLNLSVEDYGALGEAQLTHVR